MEKFFKICYNIYGAADVAPYIVFYMGDGMMNKAHILVVEDDENVAEGLMDIFSAQGYKVSAAANSQSALDLLQREGVNLVVLDVSLGADSGYDLCRDIRRFSDMPVLFLTARSSEMELIRGFQAGGDDYLTKPFRMQELLVRVQALLRRTLRKENRILRSGMLTLETEKHLMKKDGVFLNLSGVEWKIVSSLIAHYPQTLTREELLYFVWDKDADFVEANTLNVNISRLREKLGNYEERPYIETVRGIGYRWAVLLER